MVYLDCAGHISVLKGRRFEGASAGLRPAAGTLHRAPVKWPAALEQELAAAGFHKAMVHARAAISARGRFLISRSRL